MDITPELEEAIKTTQERHAIYGEGYRINGKIMMALFPNGVQFKTEDDVILFEFFHMVLVKLTRLAFSINTGKPHRDSAHDLGVYGLMIERLIKERNIAEDKKQGDQVLKEYTKINSEKMDELLKEHGLPPLVPAPLDAQKICLKRGWDRVTCNDILCVRPMGHTGSHGGVGWTWNDCPADSGDGRICTLSEFHKGAHLWSDSEASCTISSKV
jgi:hypothetical protein